MRNYPPERALARARELEARSNRRAEDGPLYLTVGILAGVFGVLLLLASCSGATAVAEDGLRTWALWMLGAGGAGIVAGLVAQSRASGDRPAIRQLADRYGLDTVNL